MLRKTKLLVLLMVAAMVFGDCQSPPPVKNFDRQKFSGSWRIHTVVGNPILEMIPPCYAIKFTGNPYQLDVTYREGDQYKSTTGVELTANQGAFLIKIHGKDVNMVILDTDYATFFTAYYCNKDDPTYRTIQVSLRSKEKNEQLIKEQISKAHKIVDVTGPRYDADQRACTN